MNDRAMVDFPVPARPLSQKIRRLPLFANQWSIPSRTPFLVPFRHLSVPTEVPGVRGVTQAIEKDEVRWFLPLS